MKRRLVALWVLIFSLAGFAMAGSSWSEHTHNGEWAFARGDFARAQKEFEAALRIAQDFKKGDPRLETSLLNLARFYEHRMDQDHAQPMYQLLLAAQEERLGPDHPALLDTLAGLGRVAASAGDVPTSITAFESYDRIASKTPTSDDVEHGRVLQLLARSFALQDRDDEGLEMQRRATTLLDKPGADNLEIAAAKESLAQMELMHGTADNAEQLILDAVVLRRKAGEPDNAALRLAQGAATAVAGTNFAAAKQLAQRALAMVKDPDNDGGASLTARNALADAAWLQVRRGSHELGDLLAVAQDTPELREAEQTLGDLYTFLSSTRPGSDERREIAHRLVQINAMQGDTSTAAQWLDAELELASNGGGRPSQEILDDRISLAHASGDKAQIVAANEALILALEKAGGPHNPRLLPVLEEQHDLLKDLKHRSEAKAIKKRIKELKRAIR